MNLTGIVQLLGTWGIWGMILAESGLFLFFFPGDSLLFMAGYLSSQGVFDIKIMIFGCLVAAIVGNSMGFMIGRKIGPKIVSNKRLKSAERFYKTHGSWAILFARFVPVVRTFAPIVAGAARMHYPTFLTYNILGATVWVISFSLLGYYFGNIPGLQDNFILVTLVIIGLSVLPVLFHQK